MPARNAACPCGSGRKFKSCCGRLALAELAAWHRAGRHAEVESRARELLVHAGADSRLWQFLGLALGSQGKDAVGALQEAVRHDPDDAVARVNLGNALARTERWLEAAGSFARALALQPRLAEAHLGLGNLRLQNAELDGAIASFRRALEGDPELLAAYANLGAALRRSGRLDEALAAYLAALQRAPGNVRLHTEVATTLRLQGRPVEAAAACRAALAIAPGSAAARAVLAEIHGDNGEFEAARTLFQQALELDPESLEALVGLSRIGRMTAADGGWHAAAQALVRRSLPPQRELQLRFALGKYYDDLQEYEAAFGHYRRANELARACGPAHDRAQLSTMIDDLIEAHDAAWTDRLRPDAALSDRPVFIVGMLRSGTTLAEQILAAHHAVHGAGELGFWAAQLASALVRRDQGERLALRPEAPQLAAAAAAYLGRLGDLSSDAIHVVDKMPTNFLALGLIHAALPRARIIHLTRDPVDTCLSIYFQHFEAANTYANDLDDLAHYYREYRRLMRHWRGVLPAQRVLEVPYEGLVEDLAGWTRRMLDFLGLPWDPSCLAFDRAERTVLTASKWQVRQKIDPTKVARSRRYEAFLGPLLALLEDPPFGH